MSISHSTRVVVVGAGFTGLCAACELAKQGIAVSVLEAEAEIGGLAGAFEVGGERLDMFYHHWFTNDRHVMELIDELGLMDRVATYPTNTGAYSANRVFKLSTPWDLLRFTPLSLLDRFRLGLLTLRARHIDKWIELEGKSAEEWLRELGGDRVFEVMWEPLLKGKFGPEADNISAVWFWNKLKLRGGSRGKGGEERLAYFRGSFAALAEALARRITELGGRIEKNTPVQQIRPDGTQWLVESARGVVSADHVLVTPALPLVAEMIGSWASKSSIQQLQRIRYLSNVCLILELDRSLSSTYWLNVNEPGFPFVGVIEHTNFVRPETYGGRHIVYLSKYLPHTDPLYGMSADEMLEFALPFLQKIFPKLERGWIVQHHLRKARWSQPVVERHYSKLLPPMTAPLPGFHLCSMAQIYPEDRGTNYAVREGRAIAVKILNEMKIKGQ
jgi:protoporphyrinogen oxidase